MREVDLLVRDRASTTVDWLKAELVSGTADLFRSSLRNKEDMALDSLARIMLSCYILSRRLGLSFRELEMKVEDQVRTHLDANHELERWYGDLSAYLLHLHDSRKEQQHVQRPGATGNIV